MSANLPADDTRDVISTMRISGPTTTEIFHVEQRAFGGSFMGEYVITRCHVAGRVTSVSVRDAAGLAVPADKARELIAGLPEVR